ncbi:MAG: polyphosphate polymerase domain-containing protein [Caldilineaceae bacterium]|nr:polyphosphate polymerase domain-containing protein [Caldilineaceae bacterium]
MRLKTSLRYELKYLITQAQRTAMLAHLQAYTIPDANNQGENEYTIASLYFDTPTYQAYWDKLEGHRNRRKVRVRVYGKQRVTPETLAYVEIKARRNKLMSKARVAMPYRQAVALASYPDYLTDFPPTAQAVLQEVNYLYTTCQLEPACVVTYQRLALNGREPHADLRITFDTQLRGRTYDLNLLTAGVDSGRHFIPPHLCVMEVKVNRNVPYWLASLLAQERCQAQRISKYCLALEQSTVIDHRQRLLVATPGPLGTG